MLVTSRLTSVGSAPWRVCTGRVQTGDEGGRPQRWRAPHLEAAAAAKRPAGTYPAGDGAAAVSVAICRRHAVGGVVVSEARAAGAAAQVAESNVGCGAARVAAVCGQHVFRLCGGAPARERSIPAPAQAIQRCKALARLGRDSNAEAKFALVCSLDAVGRPRNCCAAARRQRPGAASEALVRTGGHRRQRSGAGVVTSAAGRVVGVRALH